MHYPTILDHSDRLLYVQGHTRRTPCSTGCGYICDRWVCYLTWWFLSSYFLLLLPCSTPAHREGEGVLHREDRGSGHWEAQILGHLRPAWPWQTCHSRYWNQGDYETIAAHNSCKMMSWPESVSSVDRVSYRFSPTKYFLSTNLNIYKVQENFRQKSGVSCQVQETLLLHFNLQIQVHLVSDFHFLFHVWITTALFCVWVLDCSVEVMGLLRGIWDNFIFRRISWECSHSLLTLTESALNRNLTVNMSSKFCLSAFIKRFAQQKSALYSSM